MCARAARPSLVSTCRRREPVLVRSAAAAALEISFLWLISHLSIGWPQEPCACAPERPACGGTGAAGGRSTSRRAGMRASKRNSQSVCNRSFEFQKLCKGILCSGRESYYTSTVIVDGNPVEWALGHPSGRHWDWDSGRLSMRVSAFVPGRRSAAAGPLRNCQSPAARTAWKDSLAGTLSLFTFTAMLLHMLRLPAACFIQESMRMRYGP